MPCYKLQTTSPLAFDASADAVKAALEALGLVGSVDVSRVAVDNGYMWEVTFTELETAPARRLHAVFRDSLLPSPSMPHEVPEVVVTSVGAMRFSPLLSGVSYFARVSARNGVDLGAGKATLPVSVAPIVLAPGPVRQPRLSVISNSELLVEWLESVPSRLEEPTRNWSSKSCQGTWA